MKVRVLFFGRLRDQAGAAERVIDLPPTVATGDELIKLLGADDPDLANALAHPSVKMAADQTVLDKSARVDAAAEIAFLPPFSGG